MTEFAVASEMEARALRRLAVPEKDRTSGERAAMTRMWNKMWINEVLGDIWELTTPGRLAFELRQALGPDRGLTRAGAKALLKGGATRATRLRLMDDGLWRRSYILGIEDAWLTEDGLKVREILRKYRAEV